LEISHYQGQNGAERICFLDVSKAGDLAAPDLPRDKALARFHVRDSSGALVSGAAAFVRIWLVLPKWRWAARLSRIPGALWVMERAYRGFLPLRPFIARILGGRN
jgi:predicted DCC family thiol-disulfide oxidoreductase YuxK